MDSSHSDDENAITFSDKIGSSVERFVKVSLTNHPFQLYYQTLSLPEIVVLVAITQQFVFPLQYL
jgi:hypothetical protein